MKRVDVRLYVCVIGATKNPKHHKYYMQIESPCEFGNGRQATRILDLGFLQHGRD